MALPGAIRHRAVLRAARNYSKPMLTTAAPVHCGAEQCGVAMVDGKAPPLDVVDELVEGQAVHSLTEVVASCAVVALPVIAIQYSPGWSVPLVTLACL